MPQATAKKLFDMFNEVKHDWNDKHANMKSGSHSNWRSFCGGE